MPTSKWSRTYWADLGERVAATFIATLIPLYVASQNAVHLDWVNDLELAASAAGLSLLKGLLANLANPDSGPSLLPAPPAPEVEQAQDTPDPAAVADLRRKVDTLGEHVAEGARRGIANLEASRPAVRALPRTDPRLGRHIEHDPRSRAFPAPASTPVTSKTWRHYGPVLDQGQLGSCHDDQTEILTRRGWLPFADLTLDNELATVDPATGALTYERPTRVVQLPWNGDIYRVSNERHDFAVTGDHKMLVRRWDEAARTLGEDYEFVDMKDLGWYVGLLVGVEHVGTRRETYVIPGIPDYKHTTSRADLVVPTSTWLGFLGIYLAEGTMLKPTAKSPNKIQIAASKPREKEYVRAILDGLGVHYLELSDRFTFEHARIYRHMEGLGLKGVYAAEKFVPEFVFDLPADQIMHFLVGHRNGDGSLQGSTWTHVTSSPRLADDLARLIFLAGGRPGMSARPPRTSTMNDGRVIAGQHPEYAVRHNTGRKACIERKRDVFTEHYEGTVYCAEVPTHHTLVTRRNGKILISGNCTGNAMAQALNTHPLHRARTPYLTEADAVKLYSAATNLDDVPGAYPPQDTGSSGLAVAKAAQQAGYISAYTHAFGIDHVLAALMNGPLLVGTSWTQDMFTPDARHFVRPTGAVAGGHEYLLLGVNVERGYLTFLNSWGTSFGDRGRFHMTIDDFAGLLADQGDAVQPVPAA